MDGAVRVVRVPSIISHSQNPVGRFASYISFAVASTVAWRSVRKVDVVYVYATPMTAAIAASIWNRLFHVPFVLHVQDLWPESVTGSSLVRGGISRRIISGLISTWLKSLYRRAGAVVAIAPSMSTMLESRGVDAHRLHTIFNWDADVDVAEISQALVDRPDSDRVWVVFAGNVGHLQDLDNVIRAAADVKDLPAFRLTILGTGIALDRLKALASDLKATNVEFRGQVTTAEMVEVYRTSDFQMVSLKDRPIFHGTIPSKFQASLANGVPVISTVPGDLRSLIEEANIGLTAPPGDHDALAEVFRQACAMTSEDRLAMGRRALDFYSREMATARGVGKFEEILTSLVQKKRKSRKNAQ